MTTLRICADFNRLVAGPRDPARTAVVLDTFGARRDLSNAGVVLHEGLPLIAPPGGNPPDGVERTMAGQPGPQFGSCRLAPPPKA